VSAHSSSPTRQCEGFSGSRSLADQLEVCLDWSSALMEGQQSQLLLSGKGLSADPEDVFMSFQTAGHNGGGEREGSGPNLDANWTNYRWADRRVSPGGVKGGSTLLSSDGRIGEGLIYRGYMARG